MTGMFATDQTSAAISPVSADPTDERLLLAVTILLKRTPCRFTKRTHRVPEQNRDEEERIIILFVVVC